VWVLVDRKMDFQTWRPKPVGLQLCGFTPGLCNLHLRKVASPGLFDMRPRKLISPRSSTKVQSVARPSRSKPPAWKALDKERGQGQCLGDVASQHDTVQSQWSVSGWTCAKCDHRPPLLAIEDGVEFSSTAGEAGSMHGMGTWKGSALVEKIAQALGLSPRIQGLLLLNVMTLIMATNWVVVKESEGMMDPFTFSAIRFSVAAVAFFPFIKGAFHDSKVLKAGMEVGLWTACGYILQAVGLMSTDASRASFLSTFTVILVPILVGITGRGISKTTWGAAGLALTGTWLLENGGTKASIGDLYNLMSAAFFALQIFRTEHYCRKLPRSAMMPVLATSMATTAVLGGVLAAGTHPAQVAATLHSLLMPTSWMTTFQIPMKELLYTGLLSTDLVLLIEMMALHNVPSTDAAIIYTMEPVLGSLLAYFLLGERWGPMGWLGAGLILTSSLATQLLGGEPEGMEDAPEQA